MKNIHIIQTDKPSTLIKDIWKNTFSLVEDFDTNHTDFKAQHIYITNDKEIKEGDWYYDTKDFESLVPVYRRSQDLKFYSGCKKIILTTDQDLIKDGVQAIDDEFLEWFVKNPSCKGVKVELDEVSFVVTDNIYKIIIPKEEAKMTDEKGRPITYWGGLQEPKLSNICIKCGVDLYATEGKFICQKHPKECKGIYLSEETLLTHAAEQKQHLIDMMKSDEELGLYDESKQGTLKDAAERYWTKQPYNEDAFINGAKWQQERICDSEVIQRIRASMSDAEARRIIRTI